MPVSAPHPMQDQLTRLEHEKRRTTQLDGYEVAESIALDLLFEREVIFEALHNLLKLAAALGEDRITDAELEGLEEVITARGLLHGRFLNAASEAEAEGFKAYFAGMGISDNPYAQQPVVAQPDADGWMRGYTTAQGLDIAR